MALTDTLRRRSAYLLTLVPVLTDWIDTGHAPTAPREYVTEIALGVLLFAVLHRLFREQERLRHMTETDVLTGLYNRRRFGRDLERELGRAHRLGMPLSLVMIDVNCFKHINDTYGHPEGDAVLREVAGRIAADIRTEVDLAYRIGGDEFAALLINAGPLVAAEVQRRLAGPVGRHGITLSAGVVQARGAESPEMLLARADALMYSIKSDTRADRPDPAPVVE